MRQQDRLIAEQQEPRLWVALGGKLQPIEHHVGRVIPAHGIDRQGKDLTQGPGVPLGVPYRPRSVTSGSYGVMERLAGRDHFPAVIMAAVATDVMRTLQLTAIAALGMDFVRQSLMTASHA